MIARGVSVVVNQDEVEVDQEGVILTNYLACELCSCVPIIQSFYVHTLQAMVTKGGSFSGRKGSFSATSLARPAPNTEHTKNSS